MKIINTVVGDIIYRDDFDLEVIKEVIHDQEYLRWGDITIKPGDLVIDCGAHIGSFTKQALSMGARVIAIEPHEDNFRHLVANTSGAKNLKLVQAILYDGSNVLFREDKERNELHKVLESTHVSGGVPSVTLDSLVEQFNVKTIDLLKMDIEGAEYEVLYNFRNLDIVQQLTMEWHESQASMAKLILFLNERGLTTVWSAGNYGWGKIQCKRIRT